MFIFALCIVCVEASWTRIHDNHRETTHIGVTFLLAIYKFLHRQPNESLPNANGEEIDDTFRIRIVALEDEHGDEVQAFEIVHIDALMKWLCYAKKIEARTRVGWILHMLMNCGHSSYGFRELLPTALQCDLMSNSDKDELTSRSDHRIIMTCDSALNASPDGELAYLPRKWIDKNFKVFENMPVETRGMTNKDYRSQYVPHPIFIVDGNERSPKKSINTTLKLMKCSFSTKDNSSGVIIREELVAMGRRLAANPQTPQRATFHAKLGRWDTRIEMIDVLCKYNRPVNPLLLHVDQVFPLVPDDA